MFYLFLLSLGRKQSDSVPTREKSVPRVALSNRDCRLCGSCLLGAASSALAPRRLAGSVPRRGVTPHVCRAGSGPQLSAWAAVGVQPRPGDPQWGGPCRHPSLQAPGEGLTSFLQPTRGSQTETRPACAVAPHTRVPVVAPGAAGRSQLWPLHTGVPTRPPTPLHEHQHLSLSRSCQVWLRIPTFPLIWVGSL